MRAVSWALCRHSRAVNLVAKAHSRCTAGRVVSLSEPHLWFPEARMMKRRVVCHIGPTNSGKTYQALKALESARNGVYCGPLRLLAAEVSTKLRNVGILCSLVTGNEKDIIENHSHVSSTVEMADLYTPVECGVVDECQLIGDEDRGSAWTYAVLGLQCTELHLCGSAAMLPIVTKLCALTGDHLEIKHYKRLSPLSVAGRALNSLEGIQEGDCLVAFSKRALYDYKKKIEEHSKHKCCIIYGGLPPSARRDQAMLFSDPQSKFNCLVATDAVGMGLNLSIRRIIFSTMTKFDGNRERRLHPSEVKQISGRAGRYQSLYEHGVVTCLEASDMQYLRRCLTIPDEPVSQAGLSPSFDQLKILAVLEFFAVDEEVLVLFWNAHISSYWDVDEAANLRYMLNTSTSTLTSVSFILKKFKTIETFAMEISAFISKKQNGEEDASTGHKRCKHRQLPVSKRFLIKSYRNYDNLKLPFKFYDDNYLSSAFDDQHCNREFPVETAADARLMWTRDKRLQHDWLSSISLTYLYELFEERATLDSDGTYFLCNINERKALAKLLDTVPMNALDRYGFSLAPVQADCDISAKYFCHYASQFSKGAAITLNVDTFDPEATAKTVDELFKLEMVHRVLEMYIWLAYRYPEAFVDLDLAIQKAEQCSATINNALKELSFKSRRGSRSSRQSTFEDSVSYTTGSASSTRRGRRPGLRDDKDNFVGLDPDFTQEYQLKSKRRLQNRRKMLNRKIH